MCTMNRVIEVGYIIQYLQNLLLQGSHPPPPRPNPLLEEYQVWWDFCCPTAGKTSSLLSLQPKVRVAHEAIPALDAFVLSNQTRDFLRV